jgi:outer membrane receptor protein involved in Fe transport
LVFFPFALLSQSKLSATILTADKSPVEYANLRVFKLDSTVLTGGFSNAQGFLEIESVKSGEYYGVITAFGFKKKLIVQFEVDGTNSLNLGKIFLESEIGQEFDEVEVVAESNLLRTSIDKKVYSVGDDLSSQGGGATDVLNNIPSVEVDNDGNISLRGNRNVTILIDGRPSAMSGGMEGALDAIPASAIERIELVTNPSAKYDPDGTAGIINIVLKKNKLRGTNLGIDLSGATGNLFNGSLNFNMRNQKYNFYANYSYRYVEGYRNNYNDRNTIFEDSTIHLLQEREGTDTRKSHTGKIGNDFFIKDNQVIGISMSGSFNDRTRLGDQLNEESFNDELNRYWNRQTRDPRIRRNLDINMDYKLDFKENKGDFIAVVTQSFGENESIGLFEEFYFNPDGSIGTPEFLFQNQLGNQNSTNFSASADLTRNVNDKMRYETGLKLISNRQFRSNYLEYYDTLTQTVIPDLNVNNEFEFDEDIVSAYGILAHKPYEKLSYQVGLRLEQAFTSPRLLTTNEDFENNYFSFFPSAHIVYEPKKKTELSMSYSRRINRPNSWNLNPFPIFDDPLNLQQGNPALQPEYINSMEAGFMKEMDKLTFTSSLYFRQTVDKIQRIREFFPDGRSIGTFANVDESYDFGLEVIGIYSPFKWWKNTISFNGYETRLAATINGVDLRNSGFSWNTKLNSTFNLFKNTTTIQVNAQYVARTFTVQGYYRRRTGVDIAINRQLLDKKLTVGLRATDIFDTQGFELLFTQGATIQESEYKWLTRRVYLSVSYKFGRMDQKKEDRKRGGGESGGEEF